MSSMRARVSSSLRRAAQSDGQGSSVQRRDVATICDKEENMPERVKRKKITYHVRNWGVSAKWVGPKQAQVIMTHERDGRSLSEEIRISRQQAGILYLFTVLPELERSDIYEYVMKIDPDIKKDLNARNSLARSLKSLKSAGLIIETNGKKFYQTVKGRALWLGLAQVLVPLSGLAPSAQSEETKNAQ